jgi:hypothetical protein
MLNSRSIQPTPTRTGFDKKFVPMMKCVPALRSASPRKRTCQRDKKNIPHRTIHRQYFFCQRCGAAPPRGAFVVKVFLLRRRSRFFEGEVRLHKTFSVDPSLPAHLHFKKMMQANHRASFNALHFHGALSKCLLKIIECVSHLTPVAAPLTERSEMRTTAKHHARLFYIMCLCNPQVTKCASHTNEDRGVCIRSHYVI